MKTDHNYVKKVEILEFTAILRKDGIVHVDIKPHTHIDLDVQGRMVEVYNEITEIPRPFIFTGGAFVTINKEARANAVTMENEVPILGTAIIARNLGQKILADYYYKINKPKRPLKVFNDFEKGIDWLILTFS